MSKVVMIGLGRMGANMVRRLMRFGHECAVYDHNREMIETLAREGAQPLYELADLPRLVKSPRSIWLMVPAAAVEETLSKLQDLLGSGDVLIDGGNSNYRDAIRRHKQLKSHGIEFIDVGTSGGVWGLKNGYCLMVGGTEEGFKALEPIFHALSPGADRVAKSSLSSTASLGYLHCGPPGAGHFVKMIHNGIEYGLMAAFAEGMNILRHAGAGTQEEPVNAETSPLADPEAYQYAFDLAGIAELWRHGSVVRSWLLDLIANALPQDPDLGNLRGEVADSGEGRWTVKAAVDVGVPTPVLSAALFSRFASRGQDEFASKVLSAMRREFGGHHEHGVAGNDA